MSKIINYKNQIFQYLRNVPRHYYYLIAILTINFLIRIGYVFYFTDYKNYLSSDMGAYWYRANERFNGHIFEMSQWTSYAFAYYLYMAFIFKILYFLHLFDYRLEIILLLGIIYSTGSNLCFYFISTYLLKNIRNSLLATLFYAFCYPLIYYNAFIMTETVAIPILVCCVYLLFAHHDKKLIMFLTGLFLGFGVVVRPAYGLFGLIFFIYIVFALKPDFKSILRGVSFALGFMMVLFLGFTEIYYMSKGESLSLYPNSASNVFALECKHHLVEAHYRDFVFGTAPPITWGNKDWPKFETDHALYDQKYFYKLSLECMKKNPNLIQEKLTNIKYLFFDSIFPYITTARYFTFLLPISNCLIFFMTLSLGIFYFIFKNNDKEIDKKKVLFLLSLPLSVVLVTFTFPPEQRYMFSVVFSIYLLFFVIIENYKKYKEQASPYFKAIILAIFLFLYFKGGN